jgi:hypothetical protein
MQKGQSRYPVLRWERGYVDVGSPYLYRDVSFVDVLVSLEDSGCYDGSAEERFENSLRQVKNLTRDTLKVGLEKRH